MSRFPQFPAVVLVLLLSTRQWPDSQADQTDQSKPHISDIKMSRMMKAMHGEMKALQRSVCHLADLKAIKQQLVDLEDKVSRQNQMVATVEELVSRQNQAAATVEELVSRQNQAAATVEELVSRQNQATATVEELVSRQNQTTATVEELVSRQNQAAATVEELVSRQNQTAATVEELVSRQNQMVVRQEDRFSEFCRTRHMGMFGGVIPDSSVTASSVFRDFEPGGARFGSNRKWVPSGYDDQWLQVDLGQESRVYGVITQGRPDYAQWTMTYKLSFSTDGEAWATYAGTDGSDKVFPGNSNKNSPIYQYVDPPVAARYVRFLPQTYHGRPAMRVEILGCAAETEHGAGSGH
ncbi:uncharacterized protein LOC118429529 [Branchiostoma floridae]|uniref:Uncharacterized protein LOC118429529 n=1 Tax=Branchiostoma floridae TaxID=7739 RepID=A0A9J7M6V7_BRAFL|nr:uncharacterized protein LOC118429529 [Branchiostoma floridae]